MSKFILGNCMDPDFGLPSYPDNHFDLAIVDPPYGIGESIKKRENNVTDKWKHPPKKQHNPKGWDLSKPTGLYFKQLFRVSRNQIIWGGNYFGLPPSPCWIVWDKKNGDSDFADCELAWTSFKTAVRKFPWLWNGFQKQQPEHRIHPTQKPVALYRWLLENYAKPGDLILDTHVGSASSLIACESLGFEYVGFEIDPDYYAAATNRMSKGIQKNLFANEI